MNIAISLRYMGVGEPTSPWHVRWYAAQDYMFLGKKFGVGVIAVLNETAIKEICPHCDGLIIPGSATDIPPVYYGGSPLEKEPPVDEFALDSKLIKHFYERGKPILGLCGGHQELNIFLGGTIKKLDDPANHKHHSTRLHAINITEGSFVHDVFKSSRAVVNSYHNWEIDRLSDELSAVAVTDDGVVEAVEGKKLKVFATQWHPEVYMDLDDHIERKFFTNFLKLCEESR